MKKNILTIMRVFLPVVPTAVGSDLIHLSSRSITYETGRHIPVTVLSAIPFLCIFLSPFFLSLNLSLKQISSQQALFSTFILPVLWMLRDVVPIIKGFDANLREEILLEFWRYFLKTLCRAKVFDQSVINISNLNEADIHGSSTSGKIQENPSIYSRIHVLIQFWMK